MVPFRPAGKPRCPLLFRRGKRGVGASPYGPQGPDPRPFGLIVSTGPDAFLLVGTRYSVTFKPDSPGPQTVGVLALEEGRYENGQWVAGRRLNGDEGNVPSVPGDRIGLLKVKLYRYD